MRRRCRGLAGKRAIATLTRLTLVVLSLVELTTAQLDLSLDSVVDISSLRIFAVGGAAFDTGTGHLWIGDFGFFTNTNQVAEIDPFTGSTFTTFGASVVPGTDHGVSALAIHPTTGNLFVFGGRLVGEVTQAGTLVNTVGGAHIITAAAFGPDGALYVVDHSTPGGGAAIHRMNQTTGAYETTVPINGYSGNISSMDFDPVTGHPFVHADADSMLLEIDVATGDILSGTGLLGLIDVPHLYDYWGEFAFNRDGSQIYISSCWKAFALPGGGYTLYVLDRQLADCVAISDLGNGLPGMFEQTPDLSGELVSGLCTVKLHLTSIAQSPHVLVAGLSQIAVPFKGGVMVPTPDLLVPNAFGPVSPVGELTVDLPSSALTGVRIYLQVWIKDPFGPNGYSATNALLMSIK